MMDWTDRHCRYFHRLLTKQTLLYTEMVTTGALMHGSVQRHLRFNSEEHPVALQLGGSGACQGSCRLIYAAKGCLRSAFMWSATTESRSGLRVTAPIGDQSRVVPDQRAGLRSRALRYSSCRAARMA